MNLCVAGRSGWGRFSLAVFMLLILAACSTDQKAAVQIAGLERKAHRLMASGDLKSAEKDDEEALKMDRNDPAILNNLAVILDQEGDRQRALLEIKQAEKLRPDNSLILLNRARLELEVGHQEKALDIAKRILVQEKWPDGFRTLMGKIDIDLARFGEAHLFLHEAFERHPENPLILTYLGIVHYRIGEFSQSKEDFRKALRMHPSRGLKRALLSLVKDPGWALDHNKKRVPGLSGKAIEKKRGDS
jgi:tetratricopeptide (TPR) repeat protein